MKKLIYLLLGALLVIGVSACGNKNQETGFDEALLYGTWQEGTVFERYYADSVDFVLPNHDTIQANGATWDASEVEEDEAQAFNWTLNNATLTHVHKGTFVVIPKVYTITALTSSTLTYKDDYGKTHYYSKVD